MTQASPIPWPEALARIASRAQRTDITGEWPAENLVDLRSAGALGWSIPRQFGGLELDPSELHHRYAELAAVCLTTTLIFTQRDAAVGLLIASTPHPLAEELLRQLVTGQIFTTIGIAQLTTSRQHLPPAVTAASAPGGYTVSGTIPWATGAAHSRYIIIGAALPDAQQLLIALDTGNPHVEIAAPMKLPALTASFTTEIRLRNAFIPHEHILRGPCENALAGRAATRSFALPTCILPLGLAAGALQMARELASARFPALRDSIETLTREYAALEKEIFAVGLNPAAYPMVELSPKLRAAANSLAARTSQAALELAKGSGFLLEHPAQRRAREALFFFVWSSPPSVMEQTLHLLSHA